MVAARGSDHDRNFVDESRSAGTLTRVTRVLVVNGLWSLGHETWLLRRLLRAEEFETRLFTYSSVADDLDTNAPLLATFVADHVKNDLHLVGYSLGGGRDSTHARELPIALQRSNRLPWFAFAG